MKEFVRISSGMSPSLWGIVEKWLLDINQPYSFKAYGIDQSPVLIFKNSLSFQKFHKRLVEAVKSGEIITNSEWLSEKASPEKRLAEFRETCQFLDSQHVHAADKTKIESGFYRKESQSRSFDGVSMIVERAANRKRVA